MKKTIKLFALIAGVAFLAAGCYLSLDEGIGSVGIRLPAPSSSGAAGLEFARIFVVNGSVLLDLGDGTPYVEVSLTGTDNEVTVGPIPSGPGYQVILAIGNKETGYDGKEYFVPQQYDTSEEFNVYAGQATIADMTPVDSPFAAPPADLLGRSLLDVAALGADLYTTTSSELFKLDAFLVTQLTYPKTIPGGRVISGLSMGATTTLPRIWINTDNGIVPFDGTNFDTTFTDITLPPILDSGAFAMAGALYGYFQFDGGLGGVYNNGGANEWLSEVDLSGFVVGQPVYDLAIDNDGGANVVGYFATKLGAFSMDDSILSNSAIDTPQEVFESADFFSVTVDGLPTPIIQLGVNGTTLYVGTPRGVVTIPKATIGLVPLVVGNIIPETKNRNIKEILIGTNYQAILTNNFIIVDRDSDPLVVDYVAVPLGASSVGTPTGLFLDDGNGVVLVVGTGGLVALDLTSPSL